MPYLFRHPFDLGTKARAEQTGNPVQGSFRARLWELATRDHFPKFSREVRAFAAAPIGWLTLSSIIAAICALSVSPQVWSIFVCLVGLIAIGLLWPYASLQMLRFSLAFARDRVVEGEPVRVTARVTNYSLLAAYGLTLRSDLQIDSDEAPDESPLAARLPHCGGWRELECNWLFKPSRRGVFPLAAPSLKTGFPFGLWEARREAQTSASLLVWPATFPVGAVPRSSTEALLVGNVTRNSAGSESELLGVRPYRRGDSPRRIHWSQTARHDRLIVCELESTVRPTVQIVLDLDSSIHTKGSQGSREWSIRVAASFAKGWVEAGAQVSMLADGAELPLGSGQTHINRMLDALARLSQCSDRSLEELLRNARRTPRAQGVSVIITTDLRRREMAQHPRFDVRWVVLKSRHFEGQVSRQSERKLGLLNESALQAPWLSVESPNQARFALRSGSSEARNGA